MGKSLSQSRSKTKLDMDQPWFKHSPTFEISMLLLVKVKQLETLPQRIQTWPFHGPSTLASMAEWVG